MKKSEMVTYSHSKHAEFHREFLIAKTLSALFILFIYYIWSNQTSISQSTSQHRLRLVYCDHLIKQRKEFTFKQPNPIKRKTHLKGFTRVVQPNVVKRFFLRRKTLAL